MHLDVAFRGQIKVLTFDTKLEHPKLLSIIICHQVVLLLNTWGKKIHLWQQLSLIHVFVSVIESFALNFSDLCLSKGGKTDQFRVPVIIIFQDFCFK